MLDTHELPDDVAGLKRLVRTHRLEIEHLRLQLAQLRRWKFGRSREQLDLEITQLPMSLEALQELTPLPEANTDTEPAPVAGQAQQTSRRRRPGRRRALPAHLPRETILHPHPAVQNGCQCPDCGGRLRYLDKDQAEMLEFVPGYFKVIVHVREKHSCVRCSRIVQAGAPSRPIQRGLPGPALLAHVIASKYCQHQPLYRQSQNYGFAGVTLERSVLAQWVRAGDELVSPIVLAIRRHVLGGGHVHADDSAPRRREGVLKN